MPAAILANISGSVRLLPTVNIAALLSTSRIVRYYHVKSAPFLWQTLTDNSTHYILRRSHPVPKVARGELLIIQSILVTLSIIRIFPEGQSRGAYNLKREVRVQGTQQQNSNNDHDALERDKRTFVSHERPVEAATEFSNAVDATHENQNGGYS
jgi:hypothetical protein